LTAAVEIRTERMISEVLFPQAVDEQVHLKGAMSIDALEHIDQVDIRIDAV
jgi:hypothetical protein